MCNTHTYINHTIKSASMAHFAIFNSSANNKIRVKVARNWFLSFAFWCSNDDDSHLACVCVCVFFFIMSNKPKPQSFTFLSYMHEIYAHLLQCHRCLPNRRQQFHFSQTFCYPSGFKTMTQTDRSTYSIEPKPETNCKRNRSSLGSCH